MKSRKQKVSVITLGCSKNTVDSERLLRQLQAGNFRISTEPEYADTVIINTCGFIDEAKKESVDTILNAVALKQKGQIKKIIVSGCLSERYKKDLIKEIPEVDAYFGTENYRGVLKELGGDLKTELLGERLLTTPSHTAYLKISEGCDHPCSFCAIPLIRGKHKSKSIEELTRESELLAASGVKELVIIAQDTTSYGIDIYGKRRIHELLRQLSQIKNIEWIRLMYTYPSRFPDELISEITSNSKICNYVDIPLQHISENVLRSMRRGTTSRQVKNLLRKLRENIPDLVLRTTFITGYSNEKKRDFEELYDFMGEIKFERVGIFTYSREENTTGYILGDPVSDKIKNQRKDLLMNLQKEISTDINRMIIGKRLSVLIERMEGGYFIGRSYRDAPEVDGEVLVPAEGIDLAIGKFHLCEVYDSDEYDLFARPVNKLRKT